MKVVITIPAFNEEKTLPEVLKELKEVMSKTEYDYEVLVLDDGSNDKTVEVARKKGATVVSNRRNMGLAYTFQREIKECLRLEADIIVHTDADGQYPAEYIPKMIETVEGGQDLVLGSRFINKKYSGSWLKNIGNRIFAKVISSLTKVKITDSTTGFRAFTREIAEEIVFINSFTYTQEQIIRAAKQRFKIAEVPIHTRETRESRLFKSPLQYAIKAWINILRIYRDYEPLAFFGRIGLLFMGLGVLLGILIIVTLIETGGVGGIPRVILCGLFLTAGIQILLYGFLADMLKR
ncbi:MAG: glycosyltransferase family 2 protein [Candidatus Woesearchaeota archaeon]